MCLVNIISTEFSEKLHCLPPINVSIKKYGDVNVEEYADRFSSFGRNKSRRR